MVKKRVFPEHNYRAIFLNDKTLRFAIDSSKPVSELVYPEFYDVKVTNYCTGNCPWCYQDSNVNEQQDMDIIEKFIGFFEPMDTNQRPFQIAFGGGEPTSHPLFCNLLRECYSLGITPNYTTNGMFIDSKNYDAIMSTTYKYCGGVAVSVHPHLYRYWHDALIKLSSYGIPTNIHIIISNKESVDYFLGLYSKFKNITEYFVLLPYESQGRAKQCNIDCDYLFNSLKKLDDVSKISYGANFYEELKNHDWLDLGLYEPEIFSKYLDLTNMKLYKSSFNLEEVTLLRCSVARAAHVGVAHSQPSHLTRF